MLGADELRSSRTRLGWLSLFSRRSLSRPGTGFQVLRTWPSRSGPRPAVAQLLDVRRSARSSSSMP